MVDVFSGGLVYEFTQEVNNYGLVEIQPNGDAKILPDFLALKQQLDTLPEIDYYHIAKSMKQNAKEIQNARKVQKFGLPQCDISYENIEIQSGLPKSISEEFIDYGVEVERGKFIPLSEDDMIVKYNIWNSNNQPYKTPVRVEPIIDYMSGIGLDKIRRIKGYKSGMYKKHRDHDYNNDYDYDSEYSDPDATDHDDEHHQSSDTIFHKASVYLTNIFNSIADYFNHQ